MKNNYKSKYEALQCAIGIEINILIDRIMEGRARMDNLPVNSTLYAYEFGLINAREAMLEDLKKWQQ